MRCSALNSSTHNDDNVLLLIVHMIVILKLCGPLLLLQITVVWCAAPSTDYNTLVRCS